MTPVDNERLLIDHVAESTVLHAPIATTVATVSALAAGLLFGIGGTLVKLAENNVNCDTRFCQTGVVLLNVGLLPMALALVVLGSQCMWSYCPKVTRNKIERLDS